MLLTKKDEARFWAKVAKGEPDACWLWTAGKAGTGYGQFRLGEQRDGSRPLVPAHLVAFRLDRRRDAKAAVRHTCGNRACCNPAHLVELLPAAVIARPRKGRDKLGPEGREAILQRLAQKEKQVVLAAEFGVTQQHISWLKRENSKVAA